MPKVKETEFIIKLDRYGQVDEIIGGDLQLWECQLLRRIRKNLKNPCYAGDCISDGEPSETTAEKNAGRIVRLSLTKRRVFGAKNNVVVCNATGDRYKLLNLVSRDPFDF